MRALCAVVLLGLGCGSTVVPDGGGHLDGVDAGPIWPADAQRVTEDYFYTQFAQFTHCDLPDGGAVSRSTWSLELDSGAIDYRVCYARENLYVVDSGVLQPSQLAAYKAAAGAVVRSAGQMPPCSGDTDVDRFTVVSPRAGVVILQDDGDHCLNQGYVPVDNGEALRAVLEAATHP